MHLPLIVTTTLRLALPPGTIGTYSPFSHARLTPRAQHPPHRELCVCSGARSLVLHAPCHGETCVGDRLHHRVRLDGSAAANRDLVEHQLRHDLAAAHTLSHHFHFDELTWNHISARHGDSTPHNMRMRACTCARSSTHARMRVSHLGTSWSCPSHAMPTASHSLDRPATSPLPHPCVWARLPTSDEAESGT